MVHIQSSWAQKSIQNIRHLKAKIRTWCYQVTYRVVSDGKVENQAGGSVCLKELLLMSLQKENIDKLEKETIKHTAFY